MPKQSLSGLSLDKEHISIEHPSTKHDQRNPILTAGNVAPSGRLDAEDVGGLASSLRLGSEPQTFSKQPNANGRSRKASDSSSRPSGSSKGILEATPLDIHPYANGAISSVASKSHGNLLETASVTSGSVVESVGTSDQGDSETGFKASSVPRVDADHTSKPSRKPNKQVLQHIMSRSRSIRREGIHNSGRNVPRLTTKGRLFDSSRSRERHLEQSPRTAPLEPDRGYREAMDSNLRNRSADRNAVASEGGSEHHRAGASRLATLMNTSSKAAGDIGRAGKGFFGKFSRAGSSHDREVPVIDDNYRIKLINLPLIEQTRRTRIRQTMSEAKDKTEFWLPALPYRCIDYLNLKGCEVEGLYRVPGSVREIKYWQARFDTELDINLLDVDDLDDVNTIGSLLKAWLREQPDELIPHAIQSKIAAECADAAASGQTPQMFKDELSKLPPFNYYLLFAITAHLALLQKHSEQNKMNYHNLCICFQPCMHLEPIPFQFLVKDWRNCWQGCWPEKEYLEEEYKIMSGEPPSHLTALPPPPQIQRDALVSAQTNDKGKSAIKASNPPPRPLPPQSTLSYDETPSAITEPRIPPPAPQSSPQLPQTPTSPTIEPFGNVSPLRM